MHIQEEKSQLRSSIKQRLDRISKKDRDAEERSLVRRIEEFLGDEPKTIAAFVPLTDEVDIRPLLADLLATNWTLFLPRFEGGKLAFRKAEKLTGLIPGQFGIPEPSLSSPLLDPKHLDVVLVPGRAFTKDGKRLGRGNGGYDIWIKSQRAANPQTRFIGIGLECQVVDEIPMETHDEVLDAVLTARS